MHPRAVDLENEINLRKLTGALSKVQHLDEKGLLIERDIGLENIYALLSNGAKLSTLSSSLSLGTQELKFILTRTPEHRKRYLEATVFKRGMKSGNMLDRYFINEQELDKEQNNAFKAHMSMVDAAIKSSQQQRIDIGTGIIVQNTINVRSADDIPALPDGLEDIIEGEFEDANP